jgi:uncharacterized protein
MISLTQIETDLTDAIKSRDQVRTETLRGLKTRLQNEQIASMKDLTEDQVLSLIRSEVKRRKEAAVAFEEGSRSEMAQKELAEAEILSVYLPQGPSAEQITATIDTIISENNFTAKDFGQAMGKLKASLPTADGAELAKLLKEKLT